MSETSDRKRSHPFRRPWSGVHNSPVILFVTVCTKGRKPILNDRQAANRLMQAWEQADSWQVGRFVIMPDHVHLFCSPADGDSPIVNRWVCFWKSQFTRAWPNHEDKPLWQRDCWDRQLRNGDSYSRKWEYVQNNPVRHGLVECAQDWPYQGEINELRWHGR